MDPVTLALVAAIAAGATKGLGGVSEKIIVDAYEGLKQLLKRKFGLGSDVVKAVDGLEARPESDARKQLLREEIEASGAESDPEIVGMAQHLLDQLKSMPGGETNVQQAVGSYIAQADRHGHAEVRVNQPGEQQSP